MGTGGGPGAPEKFATWETWDESYVLLYTQQASNLYLVVVNIWDKQFGFPFVQRKDPMLNNCMINDTFDFKEGNEDDDPVDVLCCLLGIV